MLNKLPTPSPFAAVAERLQAHRAGFGHVPTIRIEQAGAFLNETLGVLYPHLTTHAAREALPLDEQLEGLSADLVDHIRQTLPDPDAAPRIATGFIEALPAIAEAVQLDAEALLAADPAAESLDAIILAYPGAYAVAAYRIAHWLHGAGVPLFPRLIAEYAHRVTGIDINPAAVIGKGFFVDHGTGVVIGETAVIGDNVKLYQGVTLGAARVKRSERHTKRHPTIEDNVVIYAHATILGGETVIGHDSVIGGNVWLTTSVPAYSRVMYNSCDWQDRRQLAPERADDYII